MPHVLISEDDRILRTRIGRAITGKIAGVTIHEAGNGMDAMNLMKAQSMDLVITDIQMPKVGGLMLLAFLNAFAPEVPCIVVTAYGTARLKSKMPSDLFRFYDKPVDVDDLALTVSAILNRRRDPNECGGVRLPDFVNMAAIDMATATITVTVPGHHPCKLFLKDGELIDAVSDDEHGEPAAIRALSWPSPDYAISFGIPAGIERRITTPLTQILHIVSECFDKA